jgi:Spy/CpxP family protein refolding chaperone
MTAMLFAIPVLAQGPPEGPRGPHGLRGQALQEHLQLTEEQQAGLKANRQTLREATKPLMQQMREKRNLLREEMHSETPNAGIIGQLNVEIKELAEQMKAARESSRADAVALLDSNQQAALGELQRALELQGIARQAAGANLLAAPEGGFGMRGGMGPGPRGPRSGPDKGFRGGSGFGRGPAPDAN